MTTLKRLPFGGRLLELGRLFLLWDGEMSFVRMGRCRRTGFLGRFDGLRGRDRFFSSEFQRSLAKLRIEKRGQCRR